MKVLVVDDDADLRAILAFALRNAGLLAVEAADADGARTAFEAERPGRRVMPNAVKREWFSFGFSAKNSGSVGLAPG